MRGTGWKRELRGRLHFVNSEQNNRIKETGLKGRPSHRLWLQAGQAISCALGGRPGPLLAGPAARDPLPCALEPGFCLAA